MSTAPLAAGRSRLADFAVMLAVALASLLLLIYFGHGEASRTYPRFLAEKMAAQGALIQTPLETFLRAGLPLRQFPGFPRSPIPFSLPINRWRRSPPGMGPAPPSSPAMPRCRVCRARATGCAPIATGRR